MVCNFFYFSCSFVYKCNLDTNSDDLGVVMGFTAVNGQFTMVGDTRDDEFAMTGGIEDSVFLFLSSFLTCLLMQYRYRFR